MKWSRKCFAPEVVALAVLIASGNALAADYLIEAGGDGPGGNGVHSNQYSEVNGTGAGQAWSLTSAHSTASGDVNGLPAPALTAGVGARFTVRVGVPPAGPTGTFSYTPIETGDYEVFVTWGQSSTGDSTVVYTLNYEGGSQAETFNMNNVGQHAWHQIGGTGAKFTMNAGTTYTVVATNPTHDGTGAANSRLMADAVFFRKPGCGDVPQVTVKVPVIAGDTIVKVLGVAGASKVDVYANGTPPVLGSNTSPGTGEVNVTTSALAGGVHINATQTLTSNGNASCILADGPIVGDRAQIPAVTVSGAYLPPGNTVFSSVLKAGDTKVRVSGVRSDASKVTVYKNGTTAIGTNLAPGGTTDVDVTVTALVAGDIISATQTLPSFSQVGVGLEGAVPTTGPTVDSPTQVGGVAVVGMTDANRGTVRVSGTSQYASTVTVIDETNGSAVIGTSGSPVAGTTVVTVSPLVEGHVIKAYQSIRGIDGALSAGRRVMAANIIEDFQDLTAAAANAANPPLGGGGANRVWYTAGDSGFFVTTPSVSTLFGSPSIRYLDNGGLNGMYAIYDQIIPADGTYHLQAEMLIDEAGALDTAWLSQFQMGVIVNGVHRTPAATIPACTLSGDYTGPLTPQYDQGDGDGGTVVVVLAATMVDLHAGDSLLIAFATNVTTYTKSPAPTGTPFPAMKIDNIKLNIGPRPCRREDVPAVSITKGPLESGGNQVIVSGISTSPAASLVTVYEFPEEVPSRNPLGSIDPQGVGEATVTLDAGKTLIEGKTIVATQTLMVCTPPEAKEGLPPTVGPIVGKGKNTAIRLTIGIRENTALAGPIGSDGGVTGTNFEWIGSTTAGSAPQGKLITPSGTWQTVTFSSARSGGSDPVMAGLSAGNGVLDGAFGVLENFSFTTTGTNTGRYVIYIDNVMNGATTIADFEASATTLNAVALFRAPDFSGTTTPHILAPPAVSTVDELKFDTGSRSLRVEFQFKDNLATRWLRLSTNDVDPDPPVDMPYQNPQVDLNQPISVRLLLQACNFPFADADADSDVDMDDFGAFQACFSGSTLTSGPYCSCFDTDVPQDGDVDGVDFAAFLNCVTGPEVPFVPAEHLLCVP